MLLQQSYFSSVLLNQKALKELKTHVPVSPRGHRLCYSTCAWPFWPVLCCTYSLPQKTLGQLIVTKEPVGASSWYWQLHHLMLSLSQSKAAGSCVNMLLLGSKNSDQNCFLLRRALKTKNNVNLFMGKICTKGCALTGHVFDAAQLCLPASEGMEDYPHSPLFLSL